LKSFLRFFAFIGSEKNIGSFDVFDDALQAHRGIATEVMPNTVQIVPLCFQHFDYVGDFVWLPWVKAQIAEKSQSLGGQSRKLLLQQI
jgi:hypothetical protein